MEQSSTVYLRRLEIQKRLKGDEAVLAYQGPSAIRNNDVHHPFHANRTAYYVTGVNEPNCWTLITKNEQIIWSEPNHPKRLIWEEARIADNYCQEHGFSQWYPIELLATKLPQYLKNISLVHTNAPPPK